MGPAPGGDRLPYLHDSGTGPALLLLHAFPQDASMWDQQVAALSGRYRCLRPDAYGCGSSPAPPPGLTLEAWARAVLTVLDRAGADRVAVAGASMGGYLAFALLRTAAERIAGLCLVGSRATADSDPTRADRLALAERLRGDGSSALTELVEAQPPRLLSARGLAERHISDPVRGRIRRCTPAGLAVLSEIMASRPDSTPLLTGIAVATLVVAGGDDPLIPTAEARATAAGIPGGRLELVEGGGHLVGLEHPAAVSALLAGWLQEVWGERVA